MSGFSSWQNATNAADADNDGMVTPRDALVVLNAVQHVIAQQLGGETGTLQGAGSPGYLPIFRAPLSADFQQQPNGEAVFLDVNGDGWASIEDFGAVLEALAGNLVSPLAPPGPGGFPLEPVPLPPQLDDPPLNSIPTVTPPSTEPPPEVGTPYPGGDPGGTTGDPAGPAVPVCGTLPPTAGPATFNKYRDASGQWVVGTPAFTSLNDAQNEGLLVGFDWDNVHRSVYGTPFDEATDLLVPVSPDNPVWNDSYFAWLEVVGVRTYTRYDLIPGATLSNNSSQTVTNDLSATETRTTGWSVGTGINVTAAREVVANAGIISAKASTALQQQVNTSSSMQRTDTVTQSTTVTVPPCAVASLYQMHEVVEVLVDYIEWQDTTFGLVRGFTPVRGSFTATSQLNLGRHVEQTRPLLAGAPNSTPPAPTPPPQTLVPWTP
ncbi:MAG: hypothetical protein U0935_23865 [Pirellulales bacterium]